MPDITTIDLDGTSYSLNDVESRRLGSLMLKHTAQELTASQISQAFTNLGLKNSAGLSYELITTLTVQCPAGATVTAVKGVLSYTDVADDGSITFVLPNDNTSIGRWSVTISAEGHNSRSGTVQVSAIGEDANIALSWREATLTVTHPAGSSESTVLITCSNGVTNLRSYADSTTTSSEFQITAAGEWTVTATQGNIHSAVSTTVVIPADLNGTFTASLAWTDILLNVTHPRNATVSLVNANTGEIITGTTSSTVTRYYVPTGSYNFTASSAKHSSLSGSTSCSITNSTAYDYSIGTDWSDTIVTYTYPEGATTTLIADGTYEAVLLSYTSTSKTYSLRTAEVTYTFTATSTFHTAKQKNNYVSTLNNDIADSTLAWTDTILYIYHPSGATVRCVNTDTDTSVRCSTSGVMTTATITAAGTYSVTASATGHTSLTRSGIVVTSVEEDLTSVDVCDTRFTWNDTTITIYVPSEATSVTCINVDTEDEYTVTKTTSKVTVLVDKVGSYKFTIVSPLDSETERALHYNVTATRTVSSLNDTPTYPTQIAWTRILVKITRPDSGTVTCVSDTTGNSISTTVYSGDTSIVLAYLNENGDWTATATSTYHTSVSMAMTNINCQRTSAYVFNMGYWQDYLVKINHPSTATEATVSMSSTGAASDFELVESTATYHKYSLKVIGVTYTFLCSSSASPALHSAVSVGFAPTSYSFSGVYTDRTLSWTTIRVNMTVPKGASVTARYLNTSKTSTLYQSGTTTDVVVCFLGTNTWALMAWANAHTAFSAGLTITDEQVAGNTAVTYDFGLVYNSNDGYWHYASDGKISDSTVYVMYSPGVSISLVCGSYTNSYITNSGEASETYSGTSRLVVPYIGETTITVSFGSQSNSGTTTISQYGTIVNTSSTAIDLRFNVPTAYTELQYLSASGGGYVNTYLTFSSSMTISVNFSLTSGAIGGTYSEVSSGYGDPTVWLAFPAIVNGSCGNYVGDTTPVSSAARSGTNTVSGSQLGAYGYGYICRNLGYSLPTIYLFALNEIYESGSTWVSGRATNYATGRIYWALFQTGSTVTAAYVAAKRNSDNALGFYDVQNYQFRQGSGLTAGPAGSSL